MKESQGHVRFNPPLYNLNEMTSMYYGRDIHDVMVSPLNALSKYSNQLFLQPLLLDTHTAQGKFASAHLEITERLTNRYEKPRWRITTITEKNGTISKIVPKIIMSKNFCNLVHFERETTPRKNLPKVLIVAPYSGHYATLCRDTVATMLKDHDVYITDWDNARDIPIYKGRFSLDDYIGYLMDFVKPFQGNLHIIAVCQAAIPVMAMAALLASANSPDQPKTLTLMGGAIDARCTSTEMSELARRHSLEWFEQRVIGHVPYYYPGAFRRVVPGFAMLAGFLYLNLEKHVLAPHDFFNHLIVGDHSSAQAHKEFYDEYRSVLDLPADYFLDSIYATFKEHLLPRGLLKWKGEKVDLKAIHKSALMTIEGERDDISGVGPTFATHALCSRIPAENHRHLLQKGVGHYGVFNGRRWREEIQPKIAEFIAKYR